MHDQEPRQWVLGLLPGPAHDAGGDAAVPGHGAELRAGDVSQLAVLGELFCCVWSCLVCFFCI